MEAEEKKVKKKIGKEEMGECKIDHFRNVKKGC